MTGNELRQIIQNKWGYSYDVQFRRLQGKIFVQVMWKYLEQASFPLSEADYLAHLDRVGNYIDACGGSSQFREFVATTRDRPRLGKAVSIPLDLGQRTSEWIV